MSKTFRGILFCMTLFLLVSFPVGATGEKSVTPDPDPVAAIMVGTYGIDWLPKVSADGIRLTIAGPGDFYWAETFPKGTRPRFAIADIKGQCLDGQYYYELTALPQAQKRARQEADYSPSPVFPTVEKQAGSFRVQGGSFLSMTLSETRGQVLDVVHADDVIITGSLCVGFDCLTDGTENFGFDTIKMKENSTRIFFDDTSTTAGFPANDWRIVANDSSSGGADYFAIEDSTGAKTPFKIVAGARTSSIFVSSTGRVGFGTATPVLNLHIVHGDTPSMRLDQDTSSGWTAQVWDIAGNESNFFVRDTTGGSKLPFRIQPGAPTNGITLKADGKVGIGTWSPDSNLEIECTGSNNVLSVERTDGATMKLSAMGASGQIGTTTGHAVNFMTNNVKRLSIAANSGYVGMGVTVPSYPLHMASGAYCTAGGVWTDASSLALKRDLAPLNAEAAAAALRGLNPVTFAYKADASERHVGFIAEEVPELLATRDRRGLSPMDIVAVLTKVVQEQQRTIEELRRRLEAVEKGKGYN